MSNAGVKVRIRRSAVAVAVASLAAGAHAADETDQWYLNPQYGYTWLDEDRFVDDGDHFGFGFGKHLTERLSVEINGLWAEFDSNTARTLDQSVYSLDYLVVFGRAQRVSPYLTLGGGYIENKYENDGEYGPLVQAGVGLLMDLGENSAGTFVFQLRPEVKYRHDWADGPVEDTHGDLLVNLGFAFSFGGGRESPPPVTQTLPPPPPPPPQPPQPADADADGVLDAADRCPGTPRGVAVDAVGCPRTGPVVLRGVGFDSNAATLTPESRPELDGVAEDLRKHPRLRVELQGHTDSRGAEVYNFDLSQRRADAVRNYLITLGVSPDQLVARGYGETQPIADNETAEGRAENRRVVMSVIDNPGNAEVKGEAPN
jgi:OOP family OmpA-OmpF porin